VMRDGIIVDEVPLKRKGSDDEPADPAPLVLRLNKLNL
jgi:hypothetical protein